MAAGNTVVELCPSMRKSQDHLEKSDSHGHNSESGGPGLRGEDWSSLLAGWQGFTEIV